jgi:CRISPR/Cas system CMR-associated protein Cmr5 small subunit
MPATREDRENGLRFTAALNKSKRGKFDYAHLLYP